MSPSRGIGLSHQWALVAGSTLTVVMAVAFDLRPGEAPLHAASLGALVAGVAVLRAHLASWRCRLLQFVSSCIVAQPALHASLKLIPHAPIEHGPGQQIGQADVYLVGTQIAVVLAVVATVLFAERIAILAGGVIRACWLRICLRVSHSGPGKARPRIAPACQLLTSRYRPGAIARRGPPRELAVTA